MTAKDLDRSSQLEQQFLSGIKNHRPNLSTRDPSLSQAQYFDLFDAQLQSRHIDNMSRILKQTGQGYYAINSYGHEANAAIAAAFFHTDMAFLHYRSAAFMIQRAKALPQIDMPRDLLRSITTSIHDPISAGRHKVFGSLPLFTPPQTSTIGSHLPKAVGAAASIKRAHTLKIPHPLPNDSVILCSFGDASFNHSSALCAFNTARWIARAHYPLPLVFICEDNGYGISVPTPDTWIKESISAQPGIHYLAANGLDLNDTYLAAKQAEYIARVTHQPVFLHLKLVRLLGHASIDNELTYRTQEEIEQTETQDPLLHSAQTLVSLGWLTHADIEQRYLDSKKKIEEIAQSVLEEPAISTAAHVKASIIPKPSDNLPPKQPTDDQRKTVFAEKFNKLTQPINLSQSINLALIDLMQQYTNTIVLGEDVGKKGGVYQVTNGLQSRFGNNRVLDTLLDETTILGQAIGHAHNGFIPIPEIQFFAYLHNAEDQIRGEAATLSFFSNQQFTNPMIIRIASFAYQKGFGGHFHNDNSFAVLRDIPGLIIACPSNGQDAVKMLRTCLRLADQERRIIAFLEPIALYMQKDLHQSQDQQWLSTYPDNNETISLGEIGIFNANPTSPCPIAIISYGNGYYLSRQAEKVLHDEHNIHVKIIDLRWLAPLNCDALIDAIFDTQQVLIVDECRKTGSLSEHIISSILLNMNNPPEISALTAEDCFIPLGKASHAILPSKEDIISAVLSSMP